MRRVASPIADHRLLEVHQLLVTMATTKSCHFTSADIGDAANLVVELYERRQQERSLQDQRPGANVPIACGNDS